MVGRHGDELRLLEDERAEGRVGQPENVVAADDVEARLKRQSTCHMVRVCRGDNNVFTTYLILVHRVENRLKKKVCVILVCSTGGGKMLHRAHAPQFFVDRR